MDREEPDAAICLYRIAAEDLAGDSGFLIEYGDALMAAGLPRQALDIWLQADRQQDAVLSRLLQGYSANRLWKEASGAYEEWVAKNPEDIQAAYRLALIRAALSPLSAVGLLEKVLSYPEPASSNARMLRSAILRASRTGNESYLYAIAGEALIRMEEWGLALAALQEAVAKNPEYGEAYAYLGLAKEREGDDPSLEYAAGVRYAPASATPCLLYGSWLRRTGDFDLARIWLARAWNLDPGDWAVADELARLDFETGNVQNAEIWLLQAVAAHPQSADAWTALAAFYIDHELRVEQSGIPAARQALLLAPDNLAAMMLMGRAYYRIGEFAEAASFFIRVTRMDNSSVEAFWYLGLCLSDLGSRDAAAAALENVLRIDPEGAYGERAREMLEALRVSE